MSIWHTAECQALLRDLEQTPRRVQLHHADLESLIAWCMDEIFELAKTDEHKGSAGTTSSCGRARGIWPFLLNPAAGLCNIVL